MLRHAPRALLFACLLALAASACRSPEDARHETREQRDSFEQAMDDDS